MKTLIEMSLEELVDRVERLNYKEEEVVAEKVEIRNEIAIRLKKEKRDSKIVGDWALTLYKKVLFKTTVVQAREFGATKSEEKIDLDKLKKLYKAGANIPGVQEAESLRMSKVNQEGDK